MGKNIYDELMPGTTEEQRMKLARAAGRLFLKVEKPSEHPTISPEDVDNECQDLKPAFGQFIATGYRLEMLATEDGRYVEHIVPSGEVAKHSTAAYNPKALYSLLKTRSEEDVLRWIDRYGYFYTQFPTYKTPGAAVLSGLSEPYPLAAMIARVNRLKDIWALIDQMAAERGPLLEKVRSVPVEDIKLDAIGWHDTRTVKTILGSPSGYYLTVNGKPLVGTLHDSPPVSRSDRSRLLIGGLASLIMRLTEDSKFEMAVTVAAKEESRLPWLVKTETHCVSPECYYLLWVLRFLSRQGHKACSKCGVLFLPAGERPGKQKYCPACSHGSQSNYKEKQRAAVRAVNKEGLSLEAAAERYGLKRERLEAILSGEKSI